MNFEDIEGLYNYLKHGDQDHQDWLKESIESYYYNKPVPEIKGSGNKEKMIQDLQEKVEQLELTIQTINYQNQNSFENGNN